ncbi:MAG: hypothetical protein R6V27_07655 [Balneolaceae bacterium]
MQTAELQSEVSLINKSNKNTAQKITDLQEFPRVVRGILAESEANVKSEKGEEDIEY